MSWGFMRWSYVVNTATELEIWRNSDYYINVDMSRYIFSSHKEMHISDKYLF